MFEENTFCSGATFIPKSGGLKEDDGWIITFVHNETSNISQASCLLHDKVLHRSRIFTYFKRLGMYYTILQVFIIDAKDFSSEPIAKITLPARVPYGFHGTFISTFSQQGIIVN